MILVAALFLLFFNILSEGNTHRFKYSQSQNNFLDTNLNNSVSIKDAVDYAAHLLEGEIISAEKKFRKDIPIWKINLVTLQRGIIEFEISGLDKSLLRIDADQGPFDYNLKSDSTLLSFIAARKIAEDVNSQKILKWNFTKNKDKWEYDFWLFTKTGKAQVRVDAESGEILSNKKKK